MPKGQTACPYIFRRGALFYFRFVFPDRVAKLIGQRENWRCTQHNLPESEIAGELVALEYLARDTKEDLRQHDYSTWKPQLAVLHPLVSHVDSGM